MKKILVALALLAFLAMPGVANASFVSTLDFEGFLRYNGVGNLDPIDTFCDELEEGGSCGDPGDGSSYGVLGILYELDLDLPDDPVEIPWWLEVEFRLIGRHAHDGVVDGFRFDLEDFLEEEYGIDNSFDIGTFSLTEDEAVNFFVNLPSGGNIGPLAFLHGFDPDDQEGAFLLTDDLNLLDFDPDEELRVNFIGRLTLTGYKEESNAIPEPATMLLFTSGLLGLGGIRKKMGGIRK